MNRSLLLGNRVREVLLDGHWIANTNFKEQLYDLTWQQATKKVGDLNTIAALTFHINYYLEGLLHFFNFGRLEISDKFSFNIPQIEGESDWNKLISSFLINSEAFARHVENLPDSMLDETFADKKYGTYLRNIEGVIEHSYYHLGQISLLKKTITTGMKNLKS